MIQHIKFYLFFTTLFLVCLSCNKTKTTESNSDKSKVATIAQPLQKTNIFSFYKAFAFCDSKVDYFTREEADQLYADKKIEINVKDGKIEDANTLFSPEKIDCISKALELKGINEIKIYKTKDTFPFDNLTLINDEYLVTSRDGYFFVFSSNQKKENRIAENKKEKEELNLIATPSDLKGFWAVNCANELTELDINKSEGHLSLYSFNEIFIQIKVTKSSRQKEYNLYFAKTTWQKNYYKDKLNIIDEDIDKNKPIGKLFILEDGKAKLDWIGLYNTRKQKLEFVGNDFLLIKENGGKTPLVLEKCD